MSRPTLCVVNFEGEMHLPHSLAAARAIGDRFAEIVLVDNGSGDGSLPLVSRDFPEVRVVRLDRNRGPAAARNAGLRASASPRVLFIDNDVILEADCPGHLERALDERPDAAIAMPRVVYARDPDLVQYDGAGHHFLGLMTLLGADRPVSGAPPERRDLDSLVTACFLLDRGRVGKGLAFDESFFMYYEDHDFGLRTRMRGHAILSVPEAVCRHGGGTSGMALRTTGRHHPVRVRGHIRNRWIILLTLYELRSLILLAPALALFEVFQLLGAVGKGWLGHWLRAAAGIAVRLPRILRKRRREQRARVVRDRAIFAGGPIPLSAPLTSGRVERIARRILESATGRYWRLVRKAL